MARLSVEHYRANANMTPDHVRKSSRFRDIFRSRPSSDNSLVDPATRSTPGKSALSPPQSPASPTIRPGFDQVGLLPSEQGSVVDIKQALRHSGGSRVAQVLEKEMQEVKGTSVPHNLDTRLDVASVGHAGGVANNFQETEKTKELNQIADAFKDAMLENSSQNVDTAKVGALESSPCDNNFEEVPLRSLHHSKSQEELREKKHIGSSTAGHAGDSVVGDGDETEMLRGAELTTGIYVATKQSRDRDLGTGLDSGVSSHNGKKRSGSSRHQQPAFSFLPSPNQDKRIGRDMFAVPNSGTFYNEGSDALSDADEDAERRSSRSSLASNIFNGGDSLSQGIREYVASKIAESEHARAQGSAVTDVDADYITLSLRAELRQRKDGPGKITGPAAVVPSMLFGTKKSIGNIVIKDIALASISQLVVVMVYVWIALALLFHGPATMFYTIFATAIVLITYSSVVGRCEIPLETQDLLLSPLELLMGAVVEQVVLVASNVLERTARLLAVTLRAATDDVKVEAKKE